MRPGNLRVVVVGLVAVLVSCQSVPAQQTEPRASDAAASSAAVAPTAAGPVNVPAGTAASGPALPADIVAVTSAIVDASTTQAALEGTRKALEMSGVLIVDDVAKRQGAAAQIYISTTELEQIAAEAQQRATLTRATFFDFGYTLAGVATLPAGTAAPVTLPGQDSVQLKIADQPARLAAFLTNWVNTAIKYHTSAEPSEVALTNAPLLLAALALRQEDGVDLRQPFLPSDLRLGSLDMLLLIAGLRASIFAARRATPAASSSPSQVPTSASPSPASSPRASNSSSPVPSSSIPSSASPSPSPQSRLGDGPIAGGPRFASLAAATSSCDAMMQYLQSSATGVADLTSFTYGEALKGYVSEFVTDLVHGTPSLEQRLGVFLEVLGILARLQALVLLYSSVQVKTEVTPGAVHKATDATSTVTAKVTAGIPDAEWNRAQNASDQNPIRSQARACARDLGLPVLSNVTDIGAAMQNWHVDWDITRGSPQHANLPGDQFLGPGAVASRLERPMQPAGTHSATDSITVNITPEKASDHPGVLKQGDVLVCSKVRTDPPPDFKTILNAGLSGSGASGMPITSDAQKIASAGEKLFGPAAIASLVATIVDLLASFIQNVATFNSCGPVKVGYHEPKPGAWSGTIHIESEMVNSAKFDQSGTTRYAARGGGTLSIHYEKHEETSTTIRSEEQLIVRGDDQAVPGGASSSVTLDARQTSQGFNQSIVSNLQEGVSGSGCLFTSATVSEYSGSFSYGSDAAHVSVQLSPDGSYILSYSTDHAPLATLTVSGTDSTLVQPTGQALSVTFGGAILAPARDCTRTDSSRPGTKPAIMLSASPSTLLKGQLDPKNPGDHITGSVEVFNEFDGSTSIVTWDLQHDGPIHLPAR